MPLHDPPPPFATTKHEIKGCARCGAPFECKSNNPVHCACAGVVLSRELYESISDCYDDCLCVPCLQAIAADPELLAKGA